MSDRPPNQITRIAAVGGLVTMFLLVIVVVASSGGGGDDSGGGAGSGTLSGDRTSTNPHVEKALEKGVYRVKAGDTLTSISEATGVDIETLIQLNPDTDPQALLEGAKIKLR